MDIIYGLQEVTDEQDRERGHIDKYVVSKREMLPYHWQFHLPKDSFFTQHFSEELLDKDLMIF